MKWEDKDIEKYAKIEGGNAEVFSVKEGVLKKEYKCIFIYNDNKLFLVSQEPLDNLVGILDTEEEFILKKEKGEQNLLKVREYYIGQYVEPFGVYNGVMCESIVFGDIVNKCIKYVKIGKVCIEDGRCFIIGLDEEQKLLVEG